MNLTLSNWSIYVHGKLLYKKSMLSYKIVNLKKQLLESFFKKKVETRKKGVKKTFKRRAFGNTFKLTIVSYFPTPFFSYSSIFLRNPFPIKWGFLQKKNPFRSSTVSTKKDKLIFVETVGFCSLLFSLLFLLFLFLLLPYIFDIGKDYIIIIFFLVFNLFEVVFKEIRKC